MSYRADRFTVVIDTNVLVVVLIRNMLLTLAEAGFFRPRWSCTTIDEEFERAFANIHPGQEDVARRQRANIERAFPEGRAPINGLLIDSLELPDENDRHVLAAAIKTKASLIVTQNLKDFPQKHLQPHEVEAVSVDDFLADCIDLGGPEAVAALRRMRERFKKPEIDAEGLLLRVEQLGLTQTARQLTEYLSLL